MVLLDIVSAARKTTKGIRERIFYYIKSSIYSSTKSIQCPMLHLMSKLTKHFVWCLPMAEIGVLYKAVADLLGGAGIVVQADESILTQPKVYTMHH